MKLIIVVILAYVALESVQGWSIRHADDEAEFVDDKAAEVMAIDSLAVTPPTVKPVKASGKPGKPGKATGKPGKATGKPGKATGKPGKATGKPGKPGKATGKPGKATGKPAKASGKPPKATNKPGNSQQGKKPAPMELPIESP